MQKVFQDKFIMWLYGFILRKCCSQNKSSNNSSNNNIEIINLSQPIGTIM